MSIYPKLTLMYKNNKSDYFVPETEMKSVLLKDMLGIESDETTSALCINKDIVVASPHTTDIDPDISLKCFYIKKNGMVFALPCEYMVFTSFSVLSGRLDQIDPTLLKAEGALKFTIDEYTDTSRSIELNNSFVDLLNKGTRIQVEIYFKSKFNLRENKIHLTGKCRVTNYNRLIFNWVNSEESFELIGFDVNLRARSINLRNQPQVENV